MLSSLTTNNARPRFVAITIAGSLGHHIQSTDRGNTTKVTAIAKLLLQIPALRTPCLAFQRVYSLVHMPCPVHIRTRAVP